LDASTSDGDLALFRDSTTNTRDVQDDKMLAGGGPDEEVRFPLLTNLQDE
jgi:hypothetical protein